MGTSTSSDRLEAIQSPEGSEEASPNSESHFLDVLRSPEEEEETERLTRLASSDQELTREDVEFALKCVPLIVFADDEELVRNTFFRVIRKARGGFSSTIKHEGSMTECFDAIPKTTEEGKLPMVLCRDGEQAVEATQILCKRPTQEGILIFDNCMGPPHGLDIFRLMGRQMPPKVARILFSGTHHKEADEWIEKGMLDHSLDKLGSPSGFLSGISQAYLRKILGMPPKLSSK